jgi:UDP-N-acetyl-D-mannosaminuronic acid dehydrogenase
MKIAVIGLGYVGLPLASLLAMNYEVVGYDTDKQKIKKIHSGDVPIREPGVDDLLAKAIKSGKLQITIEASMTKEADIKIITVGTPYDEVLDSVDYTQLEDSLNIIIPNLKRGDVVLLKSTVPPGTTMGIVKQRIESSGLGVPHDIGLVFSPERLIEGQAVRDFQTLPKIIGPSDERSYNIVREILKTLGGKIIRVSDPSTAETVKMVDNYARYVFLGLTNELALACEKIDVDVLEVIRTAKDDYPRNAGLLLPGPGVGGSCLNKDPFILRGVLRKSGMDLEMVKSARVVNSLMPRHVVEIVKKYRSSGTAIILGVAFKGDTDDTRFSPTYEIRDALIHSNFTVRLSDPFVTGNGIFSNFYEASNCGDLILLLTDHSDYTQIDLKRLKVLMNSNPVIVDTRGVISKDDALKNGFEYHGVGRL